MTEKKRVTAYVTEEIQKEMEAIKVRYGLESDSALISFLVRREGSFTKEEVAKAVRMELDKHYLPKEKVLSSLKDIDTAGFLLVQAINTLLYETKADHLVDPETYPHVVMEEALQKRSSIIHARKELKDDRKSKSGIEEEV